MYPKFIRSSFGSYLLLLFTILLSGEPEICHAQDLQGFRPLSINGVEYDRPVTSIHQDTLGFLWFGGYDGLHRYDGHSLRSFYSDPDDSLSLSDSKITFIVSEPNGSLLIGTQNGLNTYDPETETFRRLLYVEGELSWVGSIFQLNQGELIVHCSNLGLVEVDRSIGGYVKLDSYQKEVRFNDEFWGTATNFDTLYLMDKYGFYALCSGEVEWISLNACLPQESIETRKMPGLFISSMGPLYLFTERTVYQVDIASMSSREIFRSHTNIGTLIEVHGEVYAKSLYSAIMEGPIHAEGPERLEEFPSNFLPMYSSHRSNDGVVWMPGNQGIFARKNNKIRSLDQHNSNSNGGTALIQKPYEVSPGKLWCSFVDSTIEINWKTGKIELQVGARNELQTPFTMIYDSDWGMRYFVQKGGVVKYYSKTGIEREINVGDEAFGSLIRALIEHPKGTLWIGTWFHGVFKYDLHSEVYTHYLPSNSTISNKQIRTFYLDRQEQLWIGTRNGLNRYEQEADSFTVYGVEQGLTEGTVFTMYQTSDSMMYLGTFGGGLNWLDLRSQEIDALTVNDGLPSNMIFSIYPDKHENLWMGTPNGLVYFDRSKGTFRSYTQSDGFINKSYEAFAHAKSPYTGHLFMEGPQGIDIFHPDSMVSSTATPVITFTDFKVFNQSASIARKPEQLLDDSKFYLPQSISTTTELQLPYKYNVFGIEYALMDFQNPELNQYAYQLEGFDPDWQYVGNRRSVTYTNLDPGKYTFRVKGANADGIWNQEGTSLGLHILPPWYMTWWARLLFLSVVVGVVYFFYRLQLRRRLAINQADYFKSLDQDRRHLYANISHEFRTPLTVIQAMANEIELDPRGWLPRGTRMIKENVGRVLNLVNQLLELQKLESGHSTLDWNHGDAVAVVHRNFLSFSTAAQAKGLATIWDGPVAVCMTDFDHDKFEAVVNNVFSNCLKYVPAGGQIQVSASGQGKALICTIADDGPGIPIDVRDRLFDRFYQVDASTQRAAEGAGLGLAISKQYIEQMGGSIALDGEHAPGAKFVITLPIRDIHRGKEVVASSSRDSFTDLSQVDLLPQEAYEEDYILIAEDHAQLAEYIAHSLHTDHQVYCCKNGKEALARAREYPPNLVISDVMMPIMDGFTLCKELKSDIRTSHVPVILLTALADQSSKLQGLEHHADAHIVKPFEKEHLLATVQMLLAQRKRLEVFYARGNHSVQIATEVREHQFVARVRQTIEAELSNENLRVGELATLVHLSRSQLHNKLKSLTGLSVSHFIRSVRLSKAGEMLRDTDDSVATIAYAVGFRDPNYFSRVFSEEYGVSPTKFRDG